MDTFRHNELRDLEAEFLSMVCNDVEVYHYFKTSPANI